MHRCSTALLLTVGAWVALPSVASADENTPCSPGRAKPTISLVDPGGGGALYATQELKLRALRDGEDSDVRSAEAPGARVDLEGSDKVWIDRPGPVNLTARVGDFDPALGSGSSGECTHTVSAAFDIRPVTATKIGKLGRPRLVDRRRKLWYRQVQYSFAVTPTGPGADRSPITVRARAVSRARYPGPAARAFTRVYGFREFDFVEQRFANDCETSLICQRRVPRGFAKTLGVRVEERGARGLKVTVDVPTSYPRGNRIIPTPWGVDVEVLQSGSRIARLRAAGRCTSGGQAARCTFKKASTKP